MQAVSTTTLAQPVGAALGRWGLGQDIHTSPGPATAPSLVGLLDAIDYGLLLVDRERRIHHANRPAQRQTRSGEGLYVEGGRLELRDPVAARDLAAAVRQAVERGVRSTLCATGRLSLAVIPAVGLAPGAGPMAAVVLSRAEVCTRLALEAFARRHNLTRAETEVLLALTRDASPEEVATQQDVALCTVRTQIASIRSKTGAHSTRELISWLARLPPMLAVVMD